MAAEICLAFKLSNPSSDGDKRKSLARLFNSFNSLSACFSNCIISRSNSAFIPGPQTNLVKVSRNDLITDDIDLLLGPLNEVDKKSLLASSMPLIAFIKLSGAPWPPRSSVILLYNARSLSINNCICFAISSFDSVALVFPIKPSAKLLKPLVVSAFFFTTSNLLIALSISVVLVTPREELS